MAGTAVDRYQQAGLVDHSSEIAAAFGSVTRCGGSIQVHFDLSGTATRNGDLVPLRNVPHLTWLNLSCTKVTDAGMRHVASLEDLELVALYSAGIGDAGMRYLARCPKLLHLHLDGTRTGDTGAEYLAQLHSLETLGLSETRITDRGVRALATLPRLDHLRLGGTAVTDSGLESLQRAIRLRSLHLDRTAITDEGLRFLSGMHDLYALYLDDCRITDRGLAYLSVLPRLSHLVISGTRATTAGVRRLRRSIADLTVHARGLPAKLSPALARAARAGRDWQQEIGVKPEDTMLLDDSTGSSGIWDDLGSTIEMARLGEGEGAVMRISAVDPNGSLRVLYESGGRDNLFSI